MLIKDAIERALRDLGISTDDTTVGYRYIYSVLKSIRAELLRQEIEKKGIWTNFTLQTLKRFVLEEIDITESDEYETGETLMKSILPFPELMDTKDGKIIGGVFLANGERLDITNYTRSRNSKNRRYKAATPSAYIRDKHFYVSNYPPGIPRLFVDVDGLYENPEEVDRINTESCDGDTCIFYPDLPFYLPGYLEGRFFRMVKEDIAWSMRFPKDKTNNGTEDITQSQNQNQQNVQNPG